MKKSLLKRIATFSLAATMMCAAFSGCSSGPSSSPASSSGTAKTIKIGSIAPLTGSNAAEGNAMVNAQQIAIEEINSKGGIASLGGAKLELVVGDSQGSASTGASEAERLINQGCVSLTGTYQSGVTETASQKAEQAGVPFVVSVSATASLSSRGFSTFFRLQPTSDQFAASTVKMVASVKPADVKTCAIVYEDSVNGTATAAALVSSLGSTDLKLLDKISYSATTTTLDSEVTKLASLAPDLVFCVGYYADTSLLFKTCNEKKVSFKMVVGVANGGISQASFMNEFGKTCENFLNVNYAINPNSEVAKSLASKYQAKYGKEIINHAVLAYDAINVIAAAIESAKSTDTKAIISALKSLDFPQSKMAMAFEGDYKFDGKGENSNASLCLIQNQGGKAVVVYPEKFAASKIAFSK